MNNRFVLIALGGAAGASLRWLLGTTLPVHGFPWAILAANVFGCAVLGALLAEEWKHPRTRLWLHDFGGIGFCGGLTTMSSVALGVVALLDDGRANAALAYLGASVFAGFMAMVCAAWVTRGLRALVLPLEERP